MRGTADPLEPGWIRGNESNDVSRHVPAKTTRRRENQHVVHTRPHVFERQSLGAQVGEPPFVEGFDRQELVEYPRVRHQPEARARVCVLSSDEGLRGAVDFVKADLGAKQLANLIRERTNE